MTTKIRIQKILATKNSHWPNEPFRNRTLLNLPGLVGLKNCVSKLSITPPNRLQSSSIQNPTHVLKQTLLLLITLFVLVHPLSGTASASTASNTNELVQSPSPYLAMHGHDPVEWHAWNAGVLKKAQIENKPLFISSGYFSCHIFMSQIKT